VKNHKTRARTLLEKMTIQEKTAQMYSVWLAFHDDGRMTVRELVDGKTRDTKVDPFELMRDGIGEITRPMGTRPVKAEVCVRALNSIQKFLVEKTRLGIPALPHEESLTGMMGLGGTLFPAGINYGATWDPSLIQSVGEAIGNELYAVGSRQGLAPVLDVSRDVRWGRTTETFGEDPYLVGVLGCAYVSGMQGPDRRVLATLKHYAGHSLGEGGRNHAPIRIGRNELNDVFLLPFEMAVKLACAGSVMPAYNDLDGEPLHVSASLINGTLRGEWGFDGLVVSDYAGIALLHTEHFISADGVESSALVVKAGIDIELPSYDCFRSGIIGAIDRGKLDMCDVDDAVYRILLEKSRLGLFDNPYIEERPVELATPEHVAVSKKTAEKSIVLLKNDGMLPLARDTNVAVIGPLADDRLCMYDGYSFPVHLILHGLRQEQNRTKTIIEAISELSGREPLYSRGCDVLSERPTDSPVFPGDVVDTGRKQKSYVSYDKSRIGAAVETARAADAVVLAVGDLSGLFLTGTVSEGSDTSSLRLPGVQQELLEALLTTGKPIAVAMVSGRPYNLGAAAGSINALIEAWLPGQWGAEAIAAVLYGVVNPGGKLPVSVPKSAGAMPYYYNYKMKSAGTPVQAEFGALYPFGFGLSYTSFAFYDGAVLGGAEGKFPIEGEIMVSCVVKNTGDRAGDETIQLYIRDLCASLVRPVRELKGFKRLTLEKGEAKRITFTLPIDMLNFTVNGNERIVEPGVFDLFLGSSSKDIFFQERIELEGETRKLGKVWRMVTDVKVEFA
jgi:beta-xylosidase